MRLDELSKSWEAAAHRVAPEMSFDGDFLVLGAQTRLAKVSAALDEPRLAALLTAAHGRQIAESSLRHLQHGLEKRRDGDLVLALIHLALSGLAKLRDPKEDARRLFMADALMKQGIDPIVVAKGMLSLANGPLDKYSPDQPRVAAGNPDGGQWTAGDSGGGARSASVQAADTSATRGHEIESDAARQVSVTNVESGQRFELAQDLDLDQTCSAFIAANCKARILREFPGQYLASTLKEVLDAAKQGNADARCAKKLLLKNEYRK